MGHRLNQPRVGESEDGLSFTGPYWPLYSVVPKGSGKTQKTTRKSIVEASLALAAYSIDYGANCPVRGLLFCTASAFISRRCSV